METISMVMDAQQLVMQRLDGHALGLLLYVCQYAEMDFCMEMRHAMMEARMDEDARRIAKECCLAGTAKEDLKHLQQFV